VSLLSIAEKALNYFPNPTRSLVERLLRSDVGLRLARGALWNGLSAVSTRAVSMIATILVARYLGKEQFGEFGMINTTIGMFLTVAGFGIGTAATKYVAGLRGHDPERVGRIIGLSNLFTILSGLFLSAILFFAAPLVAAHTIAAPHLTSQLRIGALGLLLGAVNSAQIGTLTGFEAFQTNAWIAIMVSVLTSAATVVGAWIWGLSGAVLGMVAPLGIALTLNGLAMRRHSEKYGVRIDYRSSLGELRILWVFCVPAFLSGFMTGPVLWVCMAMIANIPKGYAELGLFNAANQWYAGMLFIPGVINSGILPIISERLGAGGAHQTRKILKFTLLAIAMTVIPLGILLSTYSTGIMRLYGPQYTGSEHILILCIITAILAALAAPPGAVLAASDRMWIGFLMNAGWGLVFLICTYMMMRHGALGLTIARAIACMLHFMLLTGFTLHLLASGAKAES
jgi:O-antigen/teichoic acid export membrane protein